LDVEAAPREAAKIGRPSHYPVTVRYSEAAEIHAAIQNAATRENLSYSEMQRIINRAGLQALKLCSDA
jgi:hypothetical protein